jgi:hypothetical protein
MSLLLSRHHLLHEICLNASLPSPKTTAHPLQPDHASSASSVGSCRARRFSRSHCSVMTRIVTRAARRQHQPSRRLYGPRPTAVQLLPVYLADARACGEPFFCRQQTLAMVSPNRCSSKICSCRPEGLEHDGHAAVGADCIYYQPRRDDSDFVKPLARTLKIRCLPKGRLRRRRSAGSGTAAPCWKNLCALAADVG